MKTIKLACEYLFFSTFTSLSPSPQFYGMFPVHGSYSDADGDSDNNDDTFASSTANKKCAMK